MYSDKYRQKEQVIEYSSISQYMYIYSPDWIDFRLPRRTRI